MTDMLKNCQLCPRACGADRKETAEPAVQASKSKLHAHRFICGGAADFAPNGSGTVFSLIARSAVCSAKTARSAAEAEGQNITADALAKTFLSGEKRCA